MPCPSSTYDLFSFRLQVAHFERFWQEAKKKGYEVYVADLQAGLGTCISNNRHHFSRQELMNVCMQCMHAHTQTHTHTHRHTHTHTHAHTLCVNVRTLHFLQLLHSWEEVPPHYNVMDVTSSSHDTHIEEVRRHMWVDPLAVQSSTYTQYCTKVRRLSCTAWQLLLVAEVALGVCVVCWLVCPVLCLWSD